MKSLHNIFIKNLDGYFFRENFLVSSIVTIFIIRIFLKLTHYPELSGAGLHIAHLLWGGFFMLISLLLLMSFLGRGIMNISSILGGVGFGAFIDELGKFVTSDNNYFFQPTVAIVYIIFILIYIISKALSDTSRITQKEYLVNTLEMVAEAVMNDLDTEEKKRALLYLKKSDQHDPLVRSLATFFSQVESIPEPQPSIINKIKHFLSSQYSRLSKNKLLSVGLIIALLAESGYSILVVLSVFLSKNIATFADVGQLTSSSLSAVFVIIGGIYIQRSKGRGFKFFKIAILITLLITQFFTFYEEQFRALISLTINLVLLTIVDYAIDQEEHIKTSTASV